MLFKLEVSYYRPTVDINDRKSKTGSAFTQETDFIFIPDNTTFYDEVKREPISVEKYLENKIKPHYSEIVAFSIKRV